MNIKIPAEECELIGSLIGDGYIHTKNGKYIVGFTGNPITDKTYYDYLKSLIKLVWGKDASISFRDNGIRMKIYSKPTVKRLIRKFNIPCNKGKCFKVKIPNMIEKDWNLAKHTIRGIVDTDGSVFTADKPGSPNYPSIEITTSSKILAKQIRKLLSQNDFRVANIWSYKSKNSSKPTYKVPLNGRENLKKWVNKIGFSNPYKLERALNAF